MSARCALYSWLPPSISFAHRFHTRVIWPCTVNAPSRFWTRAIVAHTRIARADAASMNMAIARCMSRCLREFSPRTPDHCMNAIAVSSPRDRITKARTRSSIGPWSFAYSQSSCHRRRKAVCAFWHQSAPPSIMKPLRRRRSMLNFRHVSHPNCSWCDAKYLRATAFNSSFSRATELAPTVSAYHCVHPFESPRFIAWPIERRSDSIARAASSVFASHAPKPRPRPAFTIREIARRISCWRLRASTTDAIHPDHPLASSRFIMKLTPLRSSWRNSARSSIIARHPRHPFERSPCTSPAAPRRISASFASRSSMTARHAR